VDRLDDGQRSERPPRRRKVRHERLELMLCVARSRRTCDSTSGPRRRRTSPCRCSQAPRCWETVATRRALRGKRR
jgi:hypothetical protein